MREDIQGAWKMKTKTLREEEEEEDVPRHRPARDLNGPLHGTDLGPATGEALG